MKLISHFTNRKGRALPKALNDTAQAAKSGGTLIAHHHLARCTSKPYFDKSTSGSSTSASSTSVVTVTAFSAP